MYKRTIPLSVGDIVGHEFPNIILVKHLPEINLSLGDPIIVQGDNRQVAFRYTLDQIGFTGELWHRILRLHKDYQPRHEHLQSIADHYPSGASVYPINSSTEAPTKEQINRVKNSLVGFIAPDSDIIKLKIEIVRSDLELYEGRLVEVSIGNEPVLYQIVDDNT